ncbi:ribonuclease H-like domain-containing protein [Tanacetum coccineum]
MFVHNSVHNSENGDDYIQDPDLVTLISKLDISDPLYLHPNDTTALTVVSIKLKGTENYQVWSCAMLLALEGKNKTGFIDGTCKRSVTDEVLGRQCDRVNAIVLGWILNSMSDELFLGQIFSKRAKHVWKELKETYDKVDGSIMFGLHHQINTLKQNGSSIADYEESHRVAAGSITGSSQRNQAFAFVSNVPNRVNFQRNAQNSNNWSRPNNLNNNRQSGGSRLACENRGFNGHTIDRCFKIIGYLADFGKKKSNQSFKGKNASSNNPVRTSESSGILITKWLLSSLSSKIIKRKRAKQTREHFPLSDHISKYLDFTRVVWVYLIKSKDEGPHFVTVFYNLIENQFKRKIKVFRSDNGTEFVNQTVNSFCADKGVIHQASCAYTPQQNVIAKRKYRHLLNVARSLLFHRGIPLRMWTECILTATYLINMLPSSVLNGKSPYEMIYKKPPSISHLRVFGCLCFATIFNNNDKFGSRPSLNSDLRSQRDNSSSSKSGNSVNTADFPVNHSRNDADSSDDILATQNEVVATLEENIFSEGILNPNQINSQGVRPIKRSSRQSVFPKNYNDFVVDSKVKYGLEKYVGYSKLNSENYCFVTQLNKNSEPKSYFKASKYSHWTDAMNQKMNALHRNGSWEIVDLPEGRKAIGSKWIYKIKYRSSGEIDIYKARLVAQGFGQKEGNKVYKLKKSLYGLKQAPKQWNAKLISTLIENGFNQIFLKSKFMIKDLGKLKYFLGIEVVDIDKGICLNQRKYVLDLLSEYVHCLRQFMHSPLRSHPKIAFKILRYLKGCPGLGIHIVKTSGMFLNAFSDADWTNKKHNTLSKPSTKAEYRALASVTSKVIWILKIDH